jgi:hypothetical protein
MTFADGSAKADIVAWREDQMDVVGHETVRPHLDTGLAGLLGEHVAVDVLIPILKEDRLTPIAPRREVVRYLRNDDASETGHCDMLAR